MFVNRKVKEPKLLQRALNTSTERASNLAITGPVNMVNPPQTRNVTLFKTAISLSLRLKSCSITKSAAGIEPESKLMKNTDAKKEIRRTYLLNSGISVRSTISFRSTDDPRLSALLYFLSMFKSLRGS